MEYLTACDSQKDFLYSLYQRLGWNDVKRFPMEKFFQRCPTLRKKYRLAITSFYYTKEKIFGNTGFKQMNASWDYLIVLDACRFDAFKKYNHVNGKLSKIIVSSPYTKEWVKRNIGTSHKDIVVVAATPWLSKIKLHELIGFNPFHHIRESWSHAWDEELGVVPPWVLVEEVKKEIARYPNKRGIIWFLQPHLPFLQETDNGVQVFSKKYNRERVKFSWNLMRKGIFSVDEAWRAYVDNLKLALKWIEILLQHLRGRIVITSDHGQLFGELGLYAHPFAHIPPLVEVPWLAVEQRHSGKVDKANE